MMSTKKKKKKLDTKAAKDTIDVYNEVRRVFVKRDISTHDEAGNNSEKLKNEIRQIVYLLYRSKNLGKTIYNNLINTIKKWRQYL